MSDQVYKILLDGKWSLEDLTTFSRLYFQNYSFLYCLESTAVTVASKHIDHVMSQYELRHGLSYVNIYDVFKKNVEKSDFPQIKSIHYASPGWIELALNAEVATQFAKVIGIYLGSIIAVSQAYKKLYSIYAELSSKRKKLKLESLKLDVSEAKEAQKLCKELAKGLGFESLEKLDEQTKDLEESSKLLMAHYRRVDKVAKFVQSGKASFPTE